VASFLVDKSASARLGHPAVAARLAPLMKRGLVATCSVIDLEVLFSASSAADHRAIRDERAAYELLPTEQPALDRAVDVQAALAERGEHRGASLPDLIVAAVAERAGVTVMHYDSDYDLIASVTGQPVDWVVSRGSL
jgi:predicted nucleic acid-binding protein